MKKIKTLLKKIDEWEDRTHNICVGYYYFSINNITIVFVYILFVLFIKLITL